MNVLMEAKDPKSLTTIAKVNANGADLTVTSNGRWLHDRCDLPADIPIS